MNEIEPINSAPKKEIDSKKLIIIALSLSFLAICLCIVNMIIVFTRPSDENDYSLEDSVSLSFVGETNFESLTKEQAIDIVERFISGKNEILSKILPEYDEFKNEDYQDIEMLYSYDSPKDFILERNKYCVENDFSNGRAVYAGQDVLIAQETPYYTLVKAPKDGGCNVMGGGDLWIAFDKKYLDYSMQETSSNNYNDIVKFNDLSHEFVSKASPIVAYNILRASLKNYVYSTELSEDSKKYVLTINFIDAAFNMEAIDNSYSTGGGSNDDLVAINLYRMYMEIDKTTGEVSWRENDANESKYFTYKSYPLTQTEFDAIQKAYREAF